MSCTALTFWIRVVRLEERAGGEGIVYHYDTAQQIHIHYVPILLLVITYNLQGRWRREPSNGKGPVRM